MPKRSRKRIAIGMGVVALSGVGGAAWFARDPVLDWFYPERQLIGEWVAVSLAGIGYRVDVEYLERSNLRVFIEKANDGLSLRLIGSGHAPPTTVRAIVVRPDRARSANPGRLRVFDGELEVDLLYHLPDANSLRIEWSGETMEFRRVESREKQPALGK